MCSYRRGGTVTTIARAARDNGSRTKSVARGSFGTDSKVGNRETSTIVLSNGKASQEAQDGQPLNAFMRKILQERLEDMEKRGVFVRKNIHGCCGGASKIACRGRMDAFFALHESSPQKWPDPICSQNNAERALIEHREILPWPTADGNGNDPCISSEDEGFQTPQG